MLLNAKKNMFLIKSTGEHETHGFSGIFDFAVCRGVLCTVAYDRGVFSVMFLHFLQKYPCVPGSRLTCSVIFIHFLQKFRCVPKIGFSADISFDVFTDISIETIDI